MTTIAAENGNNIRQQMDVLINIQLADETVITINNDNLISCTVSLRSDLSKWNPTLPESEIEISAFYDSDISEYVANIPDGTPLTYSAGYPGDMSPTRHFYVDEQITWSGNVMHIHAVDLVSRLGVNEQAGILIDGAGSLVDIYRTMVALIEDCIGDIDEEYRGNYAGTNAFMYFNPGLTIRDIIACINNQFHFEVSTAIGRYTSFWYTYVDAGIPKATVTKPSAKWTIKEEDCGDIQKNVERTVSSLNVKHYYCNPSKLVMVNGGSAEFVKNVGVSLNFDALVYGYSIGIDGGPGFKNDIIQQLKAEGYSNLNPVFNTIIPVVPPMKDGSRRTGYLLNYYPVIKYNTAAVAIKIPSNTEQQLYESVPEDAATSAYSNFIPWNAPYKLASSEQWYPGFNYPSVQSESMSDMWNFYQSVGVIDPDVESFDLMISGWWAESYDETLEYNAANDGNSINVEAVLQGNSMSYDGTIMAYPDQSYKSILNRSRHTGSFTWKGDPRMQPRDVFTWVRAIHDITNEAGVDLTNESGQTLTCGGESEVCTVENITLSHEKGGMIAEITYREGVC